MCRGWWIMFLLLETNTREREDVSKKERKALGGLRQCWTSSLMLLDVLVFRALHQPGGYRASDAIWESPQTSGNPPAPPVRMKICCLPGSDEDRTGLCGYLWVPNGPTSQIARKMSAQVQSQEVSHTAAPQQSQKANTRDPQTLFVPDLPPSSIMQKH